MDNVLLLFRCMLFEKRVLLLSSDAQRLVDVAELMVKVRRPRALVLPAPCDSTSAGMA